MQCTVGEKHKLNIGGIEKLQDVIPAKYRPGRKSWCFVWAVDTAEKGLRYTRPQRVAKLKAALPEIDDVFYMVCAPGGSPSTHKFISNMLSPPTEDEFHNPEDTYEMGPIDGDNNDGSEVEI